MIAPLQTSPMASRPPQPKPKFAVYQNPSFSAALTANSLKPSPAALRLSFLASVTAASALFALLARNRTLVDKIAAFAVSSATASHIATRALQAAAASALLAVLVTVVSRRNAPREPKRPDAALTRRQLGLLGLKPEKEEAIVATPVKPPKFQRAQTLVPIRKSASSYSPARISSDKQFMSPAAKAPSPRLDSAKGYSVSPGTPWSRSGGRDIATEEMLEEFLADVDEKIVESVAQAAAAATPPSAMRGFGIASPASVGSSVTNSGAARSTPLRPVRMSPGSHHKYGTPPKKGEGTEIPPPMSIEDAMVAYESLGIYPEVEGWRDHLRQWFSSVLLVPLVEKIQSSHVQVMQSAASLGISITVNQVGTDSAIAPAPVNVSPIDGSKEWQPTFTLDEDGVLHQLRASLIQARDSSASQIPQFGMQSFQQNTLVPLTQACIDAINEHQRLNTLMKGELVKGLLPQSSVRADYTVQRVQELAEGTCVKNYEYGVNGEVYDKVNKKWTAELPSDSHLLGYLFCCFLDHPKWMLHVEPTSYSSTQASKNPLFLGCLPPKERFPDKYVAVISSPPPIIHPGACVLVIGKQSPPVFTLYWDKKLQFSLQGRTALWDALVLLCHRIKVGFGGVVRGLHLGSSAFNILSVVDSDEVD